MNNRTKIVIILLHCVLTVTLSYAQTKEELEDQKNKTIQDIEYTNKLLNETRKNRRATLNKVNIVNRRISLRSEIINSVNMQIVNLDHEIGENSQVIEQLSDDYDKVKEEYRKIIYYSYWNRNNYNRLMYVLSAEDFNQAYKRLKYLQQLTRFRRKQAREILKIQEELKEREKDLQDQRNERLGLLNEKTAERRALEQEKKEKARLVSRLKTQEGKLKRELKEKEEIKLKLEREIAEIIAEERRRAADASGVRKLTPAEQLISDNFKENRGRLPWPTERGLITSKFGRHEHPVLPGIVVENNGIDIATVEGAEVRTLFDGVVTKVVPILGANYAVIVRHGDFLTVYQNLINVSVKKGDDVKTKQRIGTVYTDRDNGTSVLHIEIWQELTKQNPESWLSR